MATPPLAESRAPLRRIIVVIALAWLPMMLFALPGWLRTGRIDPLLAEAEVHARLLLALGVVALSDLVLAARIELALRGLIDDGVVGQASTANRIAGFMRRRTTWLVKLLALAWIVLSYAVPILAYLHLLPTSTYRWLGVTVRGQELGANGVSLAWLWYVLIGQPLLLFVLARWLLHWIEWGTLMWRLARSGPAMQAAHIDGVGGLGFLRLPLDGLRGFIFGLGITIAAVWFDEIAAGRAETSTFTGDAIGFVVAALVLLHLPYLGFIPVLVRTRDRGTVDYTALMRRYLERFEARWLVGDDRAGEELLGNNDMSALADLGAGVAVVYGMRVMIPNFADLKSTIVAAAVPFVVVALIYGPSTAELLRSAIHHMLG